MQYINGNYYWQRYNIYESLKFWNYSMNAVKVLKAEFQRHSTKDPEENLFGFYCDDKM